MNYPPLNWSDNEMDWDSVEFEKLDPIPLTYLAALKAALHERYIAQGLLTEFSQNMNANLSPLASEFEFIKGIYQIEYAIYNLLQGYNKPEWVRLSSNNIYDGSTDVSGPNGMPCERLWFLHAMTDAGYSSGEDWIGFFTSISGFTLSQTQLYLDKKLYPISEVIDISKLGNWLRQKKALINLMRWSWSPYGENRTFARRIQTRQSTTLETTWSSAKNNYLAQTPILHSDVDEMFAYSGYKSLNRASYEYLFSCQQSHIITKTSTIERTDEIYRYAHSADGDPSGELEKDAWKLTKKIENTTSQHIDIFPTDSDLSRAPEPSTVYIEDQVWWDQPYGYSFVVQKFDGANGFKFKD